MIGSTLVGILGVLLVIVINYDAIMTTFSASRAGPLTNRLVSLAWDLLLRIHQRGKRHRLLNAAGPWAAFSLVLFWLAIAWLGWLLLFCASHDAVVNATTKEPATFIERAYFTGYTITTLGYGDYVPQDDDWRLPAFLAAGNGFFLFTLTLTYLLNVVSAVTQKRQLALTISALGQSPYQILENTADEGRYESLSSQLQQLNQSINTVGQQHLAFPILHYFHSGDKDAHDNVLPLSLARLYQALAIVCHACPSLSAKTQAELSTTRNIIEQFLDTLSSAFIHPAQSMPAIPDMQAYTDLAGIDATPEEIQGLLASRQRQKQLVAYIRKDGWQWEDVWYPPRDAH